jgi:hypothetical protein
VSLSGFGIQHKKLKRSADVECGRFLQYLMPYYIEDGRKGRRWARAPQGGGSLAK